MATTYLTRTPAGAGNRKTWTFSVWCKRANLGGAQRLTSCNSADDDTNNMDIYFGNSNDFFVVGWNTVWRKTNRLFRDTSAWYNIVVAVDTTQATADDRIKIYVNGVQETSFATKNNPSQNADIGYNQASTTRISSASSSVGGYFDGAMSHFYFIDGLAYDASTFGSTDATSGEWVINTSPSVTYGTNGFLIMKDGNTITDQGSNSNDFTLGAGTLTDLQDCPDDVFCTLNPLDATITGTSATYSNGNNGYSSSGNSSSNNGTRCTIGASSGKYYWEVKQNTSPQLILGIQDADALTRWSGTGATWSETGTYAVVSDGTKSINNTETSSAISTFTTGDIMSIAVDLDNQKFYIRKNGTWENSGDPTSGATGTGSLGNLVSGTTYLPVISNGNQWASVTSASTNFGNGYFGSTVISSEGTNASGIGKFEYDVPTGYTALSLKGLQE